MKLYNILFESFNLEEMTSGGKYIGIEISSGFEQLLELSEVQERLNNDWISFAKHITIVPPSLIGGLIELIKNQQLRPKDLKTKWGELGQERAIEFSKVLESLYQESILAEAVELGISDEAIAAKILIPKLNNFPALNNFHHITIAVPPNGKPMNSNNIQNWRPLDPKISLVGTIKVL